MKKYVCFFLIAILLFGCMTAIPVFAEDGDLDEILGYTIRVTPREDGTLDMEFQISWQVLDSTTEGPLEWVKIGIPNRHIDSLEATSDNIAEIAYEGDGGDYVRIDFKEPVYAEETITFSFKMHQTHMYRIDGSTCSYTYTPGWFDEIEVDSLNILWKADNVTSSNAHFIQDGYYVWATSLAKGEQFTAEIVYPENVFSLNPDEQYGETSSDEDMIAIVVAAFLFIMIVVIIIFAVGKSSYGRHSGFGITRGRHIYTGVRHGGCVRSCACACACACAGGGRAGCSRKDFYDSKKIQFSKGEANDKLH